MKKFTREGKEFMLHQQPGEKTVPNHHHRCPHGQLDQNWYWQPNHLQIPHLASMSLVFQLLVSLTNHLPFLSSLDHHRPVMTKTSQALRRMRLRPFQHVPSKRNSLKASHGHWSFWNQSPNLSIYLELRLSLFWLSLIRRIAAFPETTLGLSPYRELLLNLRWRQIFSWAIKLNPNKTKRDKTKSAGLWCTSHHQLEEIASYGCLHSRKKLGPRSLMTWDYVKSMMITRLSALNWGSEDGINGSISKTKLAIQPVTDSHSDCISCAACCCQAL